MVIRRFRQRVGAVVNPPVSPASAFWRGFRAGLPLWVAAAPFAVAYVVTARQAGLSAPQTQLMSLAVYAAAAQIAVAQLIKDGAPSLTIWITVLVMNLHHVLYGLSLTRKLRLSRWASAVAAFPLTDFAYGVTVAQSRNTTLPFLLGVEASVFLAWNLATGAVILFNPVIDRFDGLRLDFIVPLTFFLLLVTSLKSRLDVVVAACALAIAVISGFLGAGSVAVLLVSLLAPLVGIGLAKSRMFA